MKAELNKVELRQAKRNKAKEDKAKLSRLFKLGFQELFGHLEQPTVKRGLAASVYDIAVFDQPIEMLGVECFGDLLKFFGRLMVF